MNYWISLSGYKRNGVNPLTGRSKKYTITPNGVLNNVMVVVIDDPGHYKLLNKNMNTGGVTFGPYREANGLNFYSFLKPVFINQTQVNGNPSFLFKIGIGDGTGEDFSGTMAAELRLTFLSGTQTPTPTESHPNDDFPASMFQTPQSKDWLLDFQNASLKTTASRYNYCKLSLVSDSSHRQDLESSVEINIFDKNGNLQFVLDTRNERDLIIDHGSNGFAMLCPIKPRDAKTGNTETITFSIGDPKTDAKIVVIEDDV